MRVICAYRDPESGAAALQATRDLVDDDDEVFVLHVIEATALPWGADDDLAEAVERDVDARRASIEEAARAIGLDAHVIVDVWQPGIRTAQRLAIEARERDADLVIVVSKRASGVRGLILGSVAQGLLELSPCPVTIVRPHAHEEDG